MFLNNRAAYKLAEEYALKKEAQNKSKPPASKKAPATSDVASSEFSAAKSTSTWLSERNASLRAEAIAKIQSVITKQNERKEDAMARIECLVEMGTARLGSNNKRGNYSIRSTGMCMRHQCFSDFSNQPLFFHQNSNRCLSIDEESSCDPIRDRPDQCQC
jgi:hypothetical protein